MKTQMKPMIWFLTLLALLSAPHLASAYYDPGVQRWINRDPLSDMACRLRSSSINLRTTTTRLYTFSGNAPTMHIDAFGLWDVPVIQPVLDLACAYGIAKAGFALEEKYVKTPTPKPANWDKWFHCVISCAMVQACGEQAAYAAGWWGESASKDPVDSAGDMAANEDGRECGGNKKCKPDVKSCVKCCEDRGYRK